MGKLVAMNVLTEFDDMIAQKQLLVMPSAADPALTPADDARWAGVRDAHGTIDSMYWGPRLSVEEASATIRAWIATELGEPTLET